MLAAVYSDGGKFCFRDGKKASVSTLHGGGSFYFSVKPLTLNYTLELYFTYRMRALYFTEMRANRNLQEKQSMETKDLILRNWQERDAKALYEMCLDDTLRKSGIGFYNSLIDSQNAVSCRKNNKNFKVITGKRNDIFIGFICLSDMNRYDGYMEMEYAIAAKYRNNGYAEQAVKMMLDHGFIEMNLSVVAAWVRSHNKESARVLEKCSFTFEGRLRKHARDKSDTLCYSILKEEWENVKRNGIY